MRRPPPALFALCSALALHAPYAARAQARASTELREDFARPLPRAGLSVNHASGCDVAVVDGALRMTVAQPATFVLGQLVLDAPYAPSVAAPLVVSARIRLRQTPSDLGSVARLELVDGATWVNFGPAARLGVVYQTQERGPGSVAQTPVTRGPIDDAWHEYRIAYDGSVAALSLDGAVVARVPVALQSPRVWLQVHTHYQRPGTVQGSFDDVRVTGVPQ